MRCELEGYWPSVSASHSEPLWDDLHGAVSAGMDSSGVILVKNFTPASPDHRKFHTAAGAV